MIFTAFVLTFKKIQNRNPDFTLSIHLDGYIGRLYDFLHRDTRNDEVTFVERFRKIGASTKADRRKRIPADERITWFLMPFVYI